LKKIIEEKSIKWRIDGCLIGNQCGPGTCVATGSTTYSCSCPAGYGGANCTGLSFFFLFIDFIFQRIFNQSIFWITRY